MDVLSKAKNHYIKWFLGLTGTSNGFLAVSGLFSQIRLSGAGKTALIEQLGNFQNACREIVRRVGLVPLLPEAGDAFDAQRHVTREGQEPTVSNPRVGALLAPGYTFQSQLHRPALVALLGPEELSPAGAAPDATVPAETAEPRLL